MDYVRTILFFVILALAQYTLGTDGDDHDCKHCRGTIGASVHGSTGKWLKAEVPHRDWVCVEVEDLRSPDEICQMCEVETIRYVHRMQHNDLQGSLDVGCICAGHMEGDLERAKKRHKSAVSIGQRRNKWLALNWRVGEDGEYNLRPRKTTHQIAITPVNGQQTYRVKVDGVYLTSLYSTLDAAKYAAFDHIWPANFIP